MYVDRVKRIWYLLPMRAAKVQASLRIRAVSPEPSLLAHTSSESRATFRQKAKSLAPLNGWACVVEICHDGMLEDTNSLDGAHMVIRRKLLSFKLFFLSLQIGATSSSSSRQSTMSSGSVDLLSYQDGLENVLTWLLEAEEMVEQQEPITSEVTAVKKQFGEHEVLELFLLFYLTTSL